MTGPVKLSVIIVNYNHKYFPRLAIEALEKSQADFKFEIIVVDNASTDIESLTFLNRASEQDRITLIKLPKNIGFGQGNHAGVQRANGEFLFFHNPDIKVEDDSLQKIVKYMDKHHEIGILGPKLLYPSGTVQESCRRNMKMFDLIFKRTFLGRMPAFKGRVQKYLMSDYDHTKVQDVDLITGAAMIMRRSVYDQVGGFDKRYFLFMEDFDLCRMVHEAGLKVVYYPEVVLEHYHKRLSQGSVLRLVSKKVFWLHVASALKYFWKWRGKTNELKA